MIDENGNVKIIDPGAVISAPLSMGMGEFVAHSYGTKVYDKFIEKIRASNNEIKRLSIYWILSSINNINESPEIHKENKNDDVER